MRLIGIAMVVSEELRIVDGLEKYNKYLNVSYGY